MLVQTEHEPQTAGELIRFSRTGRGLGQRALSLDANVSTKHLSFDLPIGERKRSSIPTADAPRNKHGTATRSVSVAEYDIADARRLPGKGTA